MTEDNMKNKKYFEWYADHDNIVTLCRFLHDVKGIGIEDLLYALEKPYKYEEEWKECVQYWKERDEE